VVRVAIRDQRLNPWLVISTRLTMTETLLRESLSFAVHYIWDAGRISPAWW